MKYNKLLLITIVVLLIIYLLFSDAWQYLTNTEWLRQQVEQAGWLGPLVYFLLMLITFPFFAAGPVVWVSAAIWPIPLAILYASIGSVLCGCIFFLLARALGRDSLATRIPAKVLAYEEKLEAHPWRTVIVLRVLLWVNPAVDALIGLSRISTSTYLLATTAALVPLTAIHVLVVSVGVDAITSLPSWVIVLAAVVIISIATFLVVRRRGQSYQSASNSNRD